MSKIPCFPKWYEALEELCNNYETTDEHFDKIINCIKQFNEDDYKKFNNSKYIYEFFDNMWIKGFKKVMKSLMINENIDINRCFYPLGKVKRDGYYNYILEGLCYKGYNDLIRLVIENDRISNEETENLFFFACTCNNIEIVRLIMSKYPDIVYVIGINYKYIKEEHFNLTKRIHSSLTVACINENIEIVDLLLSNPNTELDLKIDEYKSSDPLETLIEIVDNEEITDRIINDYRFDPTKKIDNPMEENGNTKISYIYYACLYNRPKIIKKMLENENTDLSKYTAETLLQTAQRRGFFEVMKVLMNDDKIDVNEVDHNGFTCCHYSFMHWEDDIDIFLENPRVDLTFKSTRSCSTPIMVFMQYFLLNKDKKTKTIFNQYLPGLRREIKEFDKESLINVIMHPRIDITMKNKYMDNLFTMIPLNKECLIILKVLLERLQEDDSIINKQECLNSQNICGNSIFHLCCANDVHELNDFVKLLLECSIDIDIESKNKAGFTGLDYANFYNNRELSFMINTYIDKRKNENNSYICKKRKMEIIDYDNEIPNKKMKIYNNNNE